MNLPSIEPLPPEEGGTDEDALLTPARRRRRHRVIIPPGEGERADFLYELSRRAVPSFDFFLFSLLAGLVMGFAFVQNSFTLLFLAVLLAPFMAPVIGASLGTVTGALRYLLQSLLSLLVSGLILFLCGMVGGWSLRLVPLSSNFQVAYFSTTFSWEGLLVLALGAGFTTYMTVHSPQVKPLVSSVAVAYSLYLPLCAAGFGLAKADPKLFTGGLILFGIYLVWAMLVSALVFGVVGLRPLNSIGYILGAIYSLTGVLAIAFMQGGSLEPLNLLLSQALTPAAAPSQTLVLNTHLPPSATPTPRPSGTRLPSPTVTATSTPATPEDTPTPTRSLIPTLTPTQTITPQVTLVWARISAKEGGGIIIRTAPDFTATVIQSLLNGNLVAILPDSPTDQGGGVLWVHIRTTSGVEGWVVSSLLTTATPETSQ